MSVIFKASRFMAVSISLLNSNFTFIAIFIYAPARNKFKQEFWVELMDYVSSIVQAFIIMGDFNEIGSYLDKEGKILIIPD